MNPQDDHREFHVSEAEWPIVSYVLTEQVPPNLYHLLITQVWVGEGPGDYLVSSVTEVRTVEEVKNFLPVGVQEVGIEDNLLTPNLALAGVLVERGLEPGPYHIVKIYA